MRSLLISIPVDPNGMVAWRLAHFLTKVTAAGYRDGWDIDYQYHQGKPVCSTRNQQTRAFLKTNRDAVLWIDNDAIPHEFGFRCLLDALERDDVDVVGGFGLMTGGDNWGQPVVFKPCDNGEAGFKAHEEVLRAEPGLHEITGGALGGHCLAAKRHVCERFWNERIPWFLDHFYTDPDSAWGDEEPHEGIPAKWGTRRLGHDFHFCAQAAKFGYRLWVDTRVFWGHLKPLDLKTWHDSERKLYQELASHGAAFETLRSMYGNEDWTAGPNFMQRMVYEAAKMPAEYACVECGSGLTTLLLHRIVDHGSLCVLEEDGNAPLRDYGEFDWYTVPDSLNGKPVGLVVCDGPRGSTRGGRYGMWPVLKDRMAPEFKVILDDTHRESEDETVKRWAQEIDAAGYEATVQRVSDDNKQFAVIEARRKSGA